MYEKMAGNTPVGKSPVGKSPVDKSPVGKSPRTFLYYYLCIFCPGTITTLAESINSDLQRGLD